MVGFSNNKQNSNEQLASGWATAAATGSTVESHKKARFTPSTRANVAPPMRRLSKALKYIPESLMQCCYGTWANWRAWCSQGRCAAMASLTLAKRRYRRSEAGSGRS